MVRIPRKNVTIPHEVFGQWDASKLLMRPAAPGTGIIAGSVVRAVCQAGGIRDILTKSFGSTNVINLAKATMNGLTSVCSPEEIAQRRKIIVEVA
jgi:small subunit ribosomal protein S5